MLARSVISLLAIIKWATCRAPRAIRLARSRATATALQLREVCQTGPRQCRLAGRPSVLLLANGYKVGPLKCAIEERRANNGRKGSRHCTRSKKAHWINASAAAMARLNGRRSARVVS